MFFNGFELFSMVNYIITKDALYQLSHSSKRYYDIIVKNLTKVKPKKAFFKNIFSFSKNIVLRVWKCKNRVAFFR